MYLKNVKTGQVFVQDEKVGMQILKQGEFVQIEQDEYQDVIDRRSTHATIGELTNESKIEPMTAHISRRVKRDFILRLKEEGVNDFDKGLAKLIEMYAEGAVIVRLKKRSASTGADYLGEKAKA